MFTILEMQRKRDFQVLHSAPYSQLCCATHFATPFFFGGTAQCPTRTYARSMPRGKPGVDTLRGRQGTAVPLHGPRLRPQPALATKRTSHETPVSAGYLQPRRRHRIPEIKCPWPAIFLEMLQKLERGSPGANSRETNRGCGFAREMEPGVVRVGWSGNTPNNRKKAGGKRYTP